jgi:ferritin-like metal-binding protein YciE
MKLNSLRDLLVDQLKELYSAENQIIKALPKMAKTATNPDLASDFEEHLEQTREHAAPAGTDLRADRRHSEGKKVRSH